MGHRHRYCVNECHDCSHVESTAISLANTLNMVGEQQNEYTMISTNTQIIWYKPDATSLLVGPSPLTRAQGNAEAGPFVLVAAKPAIVLRVLNGIEDQMGPGRYVMPAVCTTQRRRGSKAFSIPSSVVSSTAISDKQAKRQVS
jgi:hypothetical protein